ncbi:ras-related protein Rab-32B-like [Pecten maximus]|uniref:ras-related protein Rab-32B-like n=1 Tax=Pecten maximus TaxID=6579 RepID=UPI001457E6ED|nr:ras-related protein Rab-32B-like [Pecten maximus]
MAASAPGSNQEHLYKILVIGEFGVGKTSIIRRYTEGTFSPNYKLTIGVDFALKSMVWDENTKVNMQLWDIAGHERFGHMTRVYYKYAIGAIIVFDLSRPATFDSVLKWLNDVNSKVMLANEQPVPVLLLANKCDLEGVDPDTSKIDKFCKEHQFIGWFPTSAKSDTNVSEAIKYLIQHILELPSESQQPTEHISLAPENNTSHYDDSFETEESYNKRTNKQGACCS